MSSATPELNHCSNAKIYRAGAGAGKTTQLVKEVYEFYKDFKLKHNKEPRIVLTTFTRKATQELKERLMLKAQQNKDYDFLNFVLSRNSLLISTIHGILQVFLRQYAQVIDLDPGFEIVDKHVLFKDAKSILKDVLHENADYSVLLEEFTFKKLTALLMDHSENILKVDKTHFYSKEDFLKIQKSMCEELAENMDKAVQAVRDQTSDEKWMAYLSLFNEASQFLKADTVSFDKLDGLFEGVRKPTKNSKNPLVSDDAEKELKKVRDDIKKIKEKSMDDQKIDQYIESFKIFDQLSQHFHTQYVQYKKEKGRIGLGDLETFTLQVLNQSESRYSSFSQSYDYWLIDEFQDTAPIQVKILEKIIGSQKRFFVGDPQQSIYFFRGAREKVFEEMQNKIVQGGGVLDILNTNYRSSPEVMSFINYYFSKYKYPFEQMIIGSKLEAPSNIKIGFFESDDIQMQMIAQHIMNLSQTCSLGEICVIARKNDHLKQIAQELKKHKLPYYLHSAQGFNERREILDIKAFLKFLINPHDNFNLIMLLRSPWFPVEEKHIVAVTKGSRSISFWQEFVKLKRQPEYAAVMELKQSIEDSQKNGISYTLQNMLVQKSVLSTAYQMDSTGRRESNIWKFISILKRQDHNPAFNFLSFLEEGADDVSTEEGSDNSDAVSSLEPNQIQLMTVHMSKGLEFKHVIIPYANNDPSTKKSLPYFFDADSGKWGLSFKFEEDSSKMPLPLQFHVEKIREEEKKEYNRLFYVALTRAKEGVFLTSSGQVMSSSWVASTQIPLDLGKYDKKSFCYEVVDKVDSNFVYVPSEQISGQDLKPLFNLEKQVQEPETVSVTDQLKFLYQGVDKVVPLMKAAQEGQRLHKIFESLKYQDFSIVSKNLSSTDQKALNWVWNLKEIPFQDIILKGYAEWGFIVQTKEGSVSGQIDVWAELDKEIWILDYKTGNSQFSEKALLQLQTYGKALKNKYANKTIRLAAIYPFEEKFFSDLLN